jgi:RNA polymerase sigma factor (sigma-70 family)
MADDKQNSSGRRQRASATRTTCRLQTLSQEELLGRCLEREEEAWREFLRRYSNLIYSTIIKVGLQSPDQEDAFQSTVLTIYRDLERLRDPSRLISWIVGIAYRQGVNRIRSKTRSRETSIDVIPETDFSEAIVVESPGDVERIALEQAQQIQEALGALPDRCRRLLALLFLTDPPPDYVEVARQEGLPIGSIGPTRARCLEKMRRFFEERDWAG